MDVIRIEIKGDAKDITAVIDQLEKVGKVDKKNADQFKKNHEEHKKHSKEVIDFNTKLTHSFGELGKGIIAAFAVERIIEFGKESVKAYAEAQEAAKKLEFAVTQANGGSRESFERLKKQAEDLKVALKYIYDDEAIMGVQTKLANFGLSGKQIEGLTPAILDIAAATGKDLPEATEKAIAAINGQTKGLKDIGVAFKDTGSKAQNYNKLLEQTAKFSGAAEEKSRSLQGGLDAVAVIWGDFQEEVGKGIVEIGGDVGKTMEILLGSAHDIAKWALAWTDAGEDIEEVRKKLKELQDANEALEKKVESTPIFKKVKEAELKEAKKLSDEIKGISDEDLRAKLENLGKEMDAFEEVYRKQQLNVSLRRDVNYGVSKQEQALIEKSLEYNKLGKDKILKILQEEWDKRLQLQNDATLKGEADLEVAKQKRLKLEEDFDKKLQEIHKKDIEDSFRYNIELIKDETEKKLAVQEELFRRESEEFRDREKELSKIIKDGRIDQRIKARNELDALFKDEELAELNHQKRLADIQKESEKKRNDEKLKAEIEANEIKYRNGEIENKRALVNGKKNKEAFDKQQKEIEIARLEEELKIKKKFGIEDIKLEQEIEDKKLDLQLKSAEKTKKIIEGVHELTQQILTALSSTVENNISIIDAQMARQQKMVDTQRMRAQQGLENDLAFEERRQDELEKKKLQEQKKLKKVKELEVFLNSLAKFSEENPHTALAKALGVLATTKAVEAVFAEDGALLGSSKGLGAFARRHKSGKDVLIHGEEGEAVLPRYKVNEMGINTQERFKNFLRTPFNEKMYVPVKSRHSNADVVAKLDELQQAVLSRPENKYDWEGLDARLYEIENGIRKSTIIKRRSI